MLLVVSSARFLHLPGQVIVRAIITTVTITVVIIHLLPAAHLEAVEAAEAAVVLQDQPGMVKADIIN